MSRLDRSWARRGSRPPSCHLICSPTPTCRARRWDDTLDQRRSPAHSTDYPRLFPTRFRPSVRCRPLNLSSAAAEHPKSRNRAQANRRVNPYASPHASLVHFERDSRRKNRDLRRSAGDVARDSHGSTKHGHRPVAAEPCRPALRSRRRSSPSPRRSRRATQPSPARLCGPPTGKGSGAARAAKVSR